MKKFNIKITGGTGQSFDIFFRLTGTWDFEGKWECLPGYLFDNGGYFYLEDGVIFDYNLVLANRAMTSWERLTSSNKGGDEGVITLLLLKNFPASVSVGAKGKGGVFSYGMNGKKLLGLKESYGYVNLEIDWEVTLTI